MVKFRRRRPHERVGANHEGRSVSIEDGNRALIRFEFNVGQLPSDQSASRKIKARVDKERDNAFSIPLRFAFVITFNLSVWERVCLRGCVCMCVYVNVCVCAGVGVDR